MLSALTETALVRKPKHPKGLRCHYTFRIGANKIKSISHRSFGFRSARNFIAAIYHCCARLPLPAER